MEGDSSMEGRLRYLEQGSQQLKQQMQVMKSLVTTEVDELKGVLKQQIEDMKQIIVHQDRLYQERIRRLEARVEQLAEFSMHLAQSKGMSGQAIRGDISQVLSAETPIRGASTLGPLGSSRGIGHDETPAKDTVLLHEKTGRSVSDGGDISGLSQTEGRYQYGTGPDDVLAKYADKINEVYRHYTETASRALHPVMTLQQFTKFTKDCRVCNSSQGGTVAVNSFLPPPELLWMNCLRRMPHRRSKKSAQATANFAFERVQEIHSEHFPDLLAVLSEEIYGRNRPDLDRGQVVELFLVNDVFPETDRRITTASNVRSARDKKSAPQAAASINDYYGSDEIKECLKTYRTKLNNTFQQYVQKYHSIYRRSEHLSLQGFSDIVKEHGLLPLINKATVREIFMGVVQVSDLSKAADGLSWTAWRSTKRGSSWPCGTSPSTSTATRQWPRSTKRRRRGCGSCFRRCTC
ncbi:hypothetical protein DIPPA_30302 [Diplonema papillatum]|nr:hypothetical protein DIPPA_30302 [Diplonema papillatum]